MLYRFPISIYIIFLKVAAPSDFGSVGALEIIWGKKPCLSTGTFKEPHKQSKRNQEEKKQNPQTFAFRLDLAI